MSSDDETFEDLEELAEGTEHDPFEELAESEEFTQPETEIDEEAVWEQLTEPKAEISPEEVGEAVVGKSKFCQRCEHFSAPPEVGCTHEGTEILELVDADHYRVVNCPVVARRREVGEFD